MKTLQILAVDAAIFALLIFCAANAHAQRSPGSGIGGPGSGGGVTSVGGARAPGPYGGLPGSRSAGRGGRMHRFHRGPIQGGFFIGEPDARLIERDVVDDTGPAEQPAPQAPPPLPLPREPYVIGRSYNSLPGGCLKLIDAGISYYECSGQWYRQGSGGRYRAVVQP